MPTRDWIARVRLWRAEWRTWPAEGRNAEARQFRIGLTLASRVRFVRHGWLFITARHQLTNLHRARHPAGGSPRLGRTGDEVKPPARRRVSPGGQTV